MVISECTLTKLNVLLSCRNIRITMFNWKLSQHAVTPEIYQLIMLTRVKTGRIADKNGYDAIIDIILECPNVKSMYCSLRKHKRTM